MTQVNDFYTIQTYIQLFCQFLDTFLIAQQNRIADALGLGFDCSFEHVRVCTLRKHHTLRIAACRLVKLAGQFAFLPHELAQMRLVSIPVSDGLAGYT